VAEASEPAMEPTRLWGSASGRRRDTVVDWARVRVVRAERVRRVESMVVECVGFGVVV